jgi:hypothetical protein
MVLKVAAHQVRRSLIAVSSRKGDGGRDGSAEKVCGTSSPNEPKSAVSALVRPLQL